MSWCFRQGSRFSDFREVTRNRLKSTTGLIAPPSILACLSAEGWATYHFSIANAPHAELYGMKSPVKKKQFQSRMLFSEWWITSEWRRNVSASQGFFSYWEISGEERAFPAKDFFGGKSKPGCFGKSQHGPHAHTRQHPADLATSHLFFKHNEVSNLLSQLCTYILRSELLVLHLSRKSQDAEGASCSSLTWQQGSSTNPTHHPRRTPHHHHAVRSHALPSANHDQHHPQPYYSPVIRNRSQP